MVIIMCQVCCRHRRSWPSNPLFRQFSWWAHCWAILSFLQGHSDCLCILCAVFLCFDDKCFHSKFAFLVHQLCLYAPKIVVVFFWWFWVGISCIRPFPLHVYFFVWLLFSPWYFYYSSDVPHFCCFKSSFYVFCQCLAFTSTQKNGPYT